MIPDACFPPIVDAHTRLLILGSLPGVQSLALGRYYGNPRNQFWRLTGALIGRDLDAMAYDARLAALRDAGIGVWDVIAEATRPGSLDSAIKDAVANPLAAFVGGLPELRAVAFNGGKAATIGLKQLPADTTLATAILPSSSPAYTMAFAHKAEAWLALRRFLD